MIMTHEEFAHICLKIKSGDTSMDIPCCANCRYYCIKYYRYAEPDKPEYICNIFKFGTVPEDFCSRFLQQICE